MPHTVVDSPDQRLTLRVRAMRQEARDVLSLELDDPAGADLPAWEPGAHIDLRFANGVERQYSLCSDPDDRTAWRVAVLAESPSRGGSRYVHQTLRVGDRVTASGPINHFELAPQPSTCSWRAGSASPHPADGPGSHQTRSPLAPGVPRLGGERMAFLPRRSSRAANCFWCAATSMTGSIWQPGSARRPQRPGCTRAVRSACSTRWRR